jgi:NitT/TauT family transport system substrate-binding protein
MTSTTRWFSRTSLSLLAALAGALTLVGAGTGVAALAKAPPGKPLTSISLASLAVDDPAVFAAEQGFFRKYGLVFHLKTEQLGAATLEASMTGATQFSQSNVTSILEAASRGFPVKIVLVSNIGTPQLSSVIALPNSPVKSYKDLAGKRLGTAALNSIGTLAVDAWLGAHGVNYRTIHWVVLPFQNMGAALEEHQIDAAWVVEPFVTLYHQKLHTRNLFPVFSGPTAGLPIGAMVTSSSYAASHPDVVLAFRDAVIQAEKLADRDPALYRASVPTYLHVTRTIAMTMGLPYYPATTSMASVVKEEKLMEAMGMLPKTFDLAKYVFTGK